MKEPRQPSDTEKRLAQEEKQSLELYLSRKRAKAFSFGLGFLGASIVIAAWHQPILAICTALASAIAFIMCADAWFAAGDPAARCDFSFSGPFRD